MEIIFENYTSAASIRDKRAVARWSGCLHYYNNITERDIHPALSFLPRQSLLSARQFGPSEPRNVYISHLILKTDTSTRHSVRSPCVRTLINLQLLRSKASKNFQATKSETRERRKNKSKSATPEMK